MLLLLFFPLLTISFEIVFAINCGSFEDKIVRTKFFNYTQDSGYEPFRSTSNHTAGCQATKLNADEKILFKEHRIALPESPQFSYRAMLRKQGYYIAIFTMIELDFKNRGDRVFNLKLGDELVHTIDLVAQAGYGKSLHKWIQLDIREDVVYLNGSLPVANAYNYMSRQLIFTFETVQGSKGRAKVEAFMLLKGEDSHQYLRSFLQSQQQKHIVNKQYLASKYRLHPKHRYLPVNTNHIKPVPDSDIKQLIKKLLSLKSVAYFLCGIFAIHHRRILKKIQQLRGLLTKKNENKKKKQ